eukprot:6195111-Pleurochrysis_carterae.AAC.1
MCMCAHKRACDDKVGGRVEKEGESEGDRQSESASARAMGMGKRDCWDRERHRLGGSDAAETAALATFAPHAPVDRRDAARRKQLIAARIVRLLAPARATSS